jgi:SAM-dependent methyltransferase
MAVTVAQKLAGETTPRASPCAPGDGDHAGGEVRAVRAEQTRVAQDPLPAPHDEPTGADAPEGAALVSIVIPCFNQAHFLGEAIESVLAQTYPHLEVVVVDDGSADNTGEVAARYPGVRYVRQENQERSAARNTGLRHSTGDYLVCLDADDRLLPGAVEAGLEHLHAHPECAFAFGKWRPIAMDGSPLPKWPPPRIEVEGDAYVGLLQCNYIEMHATVVYRRAVFAAVGGFDPALKASEDFDLYLRIARQYPVCSHGTVVAEYRRHGSNTTGDAALMLGSVITVLKRQLPYVQGDARRAAYRAGLRFWYGRYGLPLVVQVLGQAATGEWQQARDGLAVLLRDPLLLPPAALELLWRQRHRGLLMLRRQARGIAVALSGSGPRLRGEDQNDSKLFSNVRRLTPVSRHFGYDRGQPIDRHYIEDFLSRHADDIHGRVLEIGDDTYTSMFGSNRVRVSDVMHVDESNPTATIVGDLAHADHIPSDTFDCIILTQTLQLIYDVPAAIRTLHRILRPGGVLLTTFPGVSQIARDRWGETWYWGFTTLSARRLFEESFPAGTITVESRGNVLAAIGFLHGLAVEELRKEELDYNDPTYQVLVMLRAVKPSASIQESA